MTFCCVCVCQKAKVVRVLMVRKDHPSLSHPCTPAHVSSPWRSGPRSLPSVSQTGVPLEQSQALALVGIVGRGDATLAPGSLSDAVPWGAAGLTPGVWSQICLHWVLHHLHTVEEGEAEACSWIACSFVQSHSAPSVVGKENITHRTQIQREAFCNSSPWISLVFFPPFTKINLLLKIWVK